MDDRVKNNNRNEAGIINAAFYTTLILLAVITWQAAGAWLEHALRKGKPLLTESAEDEVLKATRPEVLAA